ncbi:protease modulator HflC [Desulforhabdus amnigena]|jgi:membrane protease subunit HflC|uniref:Protein HflC n=1 Tax=Desulforhabdus amnigena TaxID=40218 RepID=A0A9W6FSE6_9BACT|nr:protease modulator HflC [Desulforhabdus amnigena]NLJ26929.1 protease modulator HflC [Deltaproteobacteria bacterium]GLI34517.1 protein HflC [Desulforhabdus amnigena]
MIPKGIRILPLVAVILAILGATALFVVTETEQVVVTQWGKPVGEPITQAGLHFKIPLIQKANYFEKRVMKWDGNPNQIPTKDKKYIWVDVTARWRIKDPLLFLKRVGSVSTAHSRLDGIIDSVVRDYVSNNELEELVRSEGWEDARKNLLEAGISDFSSLGSQTDREQLGEVTDRLTKGREKITREMVADASRLLPEFGIELMDIRIKRINYVDTVQKKVFDRMISERKRIAAQYRSQGEGERAAILGQMDREVARIASEAFRTSQEIRGKADAEATRIYAEAFQKNPEFYEFYRTLEFYKNFNNSDSSFILSTDADIFKYLKNSGETSKR